MLIGKMSRGLSQPAKNRILVKLLIMMIFPYSPRKNNAKPKAEYSTLYPGTNSASASGRSKGALFVSAKAEIKNIKNKGYKGIIYHASYCDKTISERFREPAHRITQIIIKPIETSYDTI
jgi:hypothetical protein